MEGIAIHISELSRRTGVSLRSLRYYEERNLLNPVRLENGYRDYSETDIEKVKIIQLYFSLGLSTKEITDFFDCLFQNGEKRQCLPNAIEVGERKLIEIKNQIEILRKAESQLERSIVRWRSMISQTENQM
ncbi:MerR family transcriptional regulator [Paenibacillus sedimenti]|uniref:MerR family transcriptional regulator n=1 Tax=Paenibacillus sedimenti TaxID=2770274 RepID=A0A926KVF4_9BACL|nr:MerR family transcriptional regulator [Paenibacillus sedimenti]MBD0384765.1 MerR family transcriptional regulator [Paenibacillus sedimenti]